MSLTSSKLWFAGDARHKYSVVRLFGATLLGSGDRIRLPDNCQRNLASADLLRRDTRSCATAVADWCYGKSACIVLMSPSRYDFSPSWSNQCDLISRFLNFLQTWQLGQIPALMAPINVACARIDLFPFSQREGGSRFTSCNEPLLPSEWNLGQPIAKMFTPQHVRVIITSYTVV